MAYMLLDGEMEATAARMEERETLVLVWRCRLQQSAKRVDVRSSLCFRAVDVLLLTVDFDLVPVVSDSLDWRTDSEWILHERTLRASSIEHLLSL